MDEDERELRKAIQGALHAVKREKGWSWNSWALKAGVPSGSLYALRNGTSGTLSVRTLHRLATAAGVPISRLMGEQQGHELSARLVASAINQAWSDGLTLLNVAHTRVESELVRQGAGGGSPNDQFAEDRAAIDAIEKAADLARGRFEHWHYLASTLP